MEETTDILIVGGGIIGCALAYALRKYGREVRVIERGVVGGQASGAAAGLLAPLGPLAGPGPFADLLLTGFAELIHLLPELEVVSGITVGYEQTGALRVVRNPKRVSNLQKRLASWQPLGWRLEWLTGDAARQQEPLLTDEVCAAVFAPAEAQLRAADVMRAFAGAARTLGASIDEQTEVVGLQRNGASVTGVRLAQGKTIACNHLVVAAGAWSAMWEAELGILLPVQPLLGQMLALEQPATPLTHIIFGDALYLAPRGQHIFVGATREEAGFTVQVTEEGIGWLRRTAVCLVPSLAESRIVATWAGLRPRTPDTRPILGPVPGWRNVTLATGHNSVGIMLSALTGRTIAEYIMTGQVSQLIAPFGVERFQLLKDGCSRLPT